LRNRSGTNGLSEVALRGDMAAHLRRLAGAMVLLLAAGSGVLEAEEQRDLTTLSVDDLMNLEVTSVARKGQKLSETPAAVFVITQDDIRRSGATSIPEILRMVPGLDVARVNGSTWAVSARGFNSRFANKMLVLIDGRTVYDPLFSGVYWDVQDTMLEDIDRIEVIRGPGGTLWGANAVNGIINIITKHSIDTQGTVVSSGGGSTERSFVSARHGGSFGPNGYYRAFAKSFDREGSLDETGRRRDNSDMVRAGFRSDWTARNGDTFTAQGDAYRGSSGEVVNLVDPSHPFTGPRFSLNHLGGGDAQFRWSARQSSRSDTSLQVFVDYTNRQQIMLNESRRTFDLDFQHHLKVGNRNDLMWGIAYRHSVDKISSSFNVLSLNGPTDINWVASAFVQDEVQLSDRLHLTAGTKLQHDTLAGLQLQPTIRMLFKATQHQVVWAAGTSAVRTPSESEQDFRINLDEVPGPTGTPILVALLPNPNLKPERINTYELGYRWLPNAAVSIDATLFHNDLRQLRSSVTGLPYVDSGGRVILPINYTDSTKGDANGAELYATYGVTENWNLALGYSFFELATTDAQGNKSAAGDAPKHQLQLRSFVRLPRQMELNVSAYYVDRLPDFQVPAYVRLDTMLSWHASKTWELSITGQNLLKGRHIEFGGSSALGGITPAPRSVYGKVTWRF
jgi:iron complex outermembrane receptor protein